MREVLITLAKVEEKSILRHLLELYQHDLSSLDGADLDAYGLYNYPYLAIIGPKPAVSPSSSGWWGN